MDKKILIVSGDKKGKNRFNEFVKNTLNIHTWNANPNNVLTDIALMVGWNGKKDENYYNFIIELGDLCNKYFDFKYLHALRIINNFLNTEKVKLVILHGYDHELQMIEDYQGKGAQTLHFEDHKPRPVEPDYTLNAEDPLFEDGVKNILNITE